MHAEITSTFELPKTTFQLTFFRFHSGKTVCKLRGNRISVSDPNESRVLDTVEPLVTRVHLGKALGKHLPQICTPATGMTVSESQAVSSFPFFIAEIWYSIAHSLTGAFTLNKS